MSLFYRQILSMGTRLDVVIPDMEEATGIHLVQNISEELAALEKQISNYNVESELSKLNRARINEEIEVSGKLLEMITLGLKFNSRTRGYYDFTLGCWTSKPDLISDDGNRMKALIAIPCNERIYIEGNCFKILRRDVKLDSGGIGKGMALKIIEKLLHELDINSAFISFGGSSVLAKGEHPYGNSWKIGIQHPKKEGLTISEVNLKDNSLSVSGNSINNRKKYGNNGHILNPVSGKFYKDKDLVSVIARDPVEAEVLSTALIVAGEEKGKRIMSDFEDVKCLWHKIN